MCFMRTGASYCSGAAVSDFTSTELWPVRIVSSKVEF